MNGGGSSSSNSKKLSLVFYADAYHPIQAGSIDGTDVLPHDNAVYRALLCSSVGLYDPFGNPNVIGDPYRTVFVGHLSHLTSEDTLRKVMSKHGTVKNLRLVRDIVTGASRGYAFVEYETDREMRRAYEDAHHTFIDDSEIIIDYSRQQLMPGWIPRRLGGGLGGKKESGQLRFGGRERPFRAPLRPIPLEDLKKLGISPPPEGNYLPRYQVPSPPRRKMSSADGEASPGRSHKHTRDSHDRKRRSTSRDHRSELRSSVDWKDSSGKSYKYSQSSGGGERSYYHHPGGYDDERSSVERGERSRRSPGVRKRRSTSRDHGAGESRGVSREDSLRDRHEQGKHSPTHERSREDFSRDRHEGRKRSRTRERSREDSSRDRHERRKRSRMSEGSISHDRASCD